MVNNSHKNNYMSTKRAWELINTQKGLDRTHSPLVGWVIFRYDPS